MVSSEKVATLFIPLFVPLRGRQPHILIYKTMNTASISLNLEKSPERGVSINGDLGKSEAKLIKDALSIVIEEAFPEPFHLSISIMKEMKCFSISLAASSLLSLIELGSSIYEEEFTQQDKEEIVEGIFSEKMGFPEGLGMLVSNAILNDTSIIGSLGSEASRIEVPPLKVKPLRYSIFREKSKLDEGLADLVAKLNSHLLVLHYLSLKHKDEASKRMVERGLNALVHFLFDVNVPKKGAYSIDNTNKLCLYTLEGE
ncbi:MAG TPA: hypothetical protein ENO36_01525 [Fervidicoccus fontis]|uniref:Uncharacterized protein n=1 Tax=Fervidicoccus fontis TaxID=683846 RepID=A0A7C2UJ29_9CREN|nr:MAG: hypothetical protein C0179_06800 [Fervidicoccus sp.]HEU97522.1 hypothetical protein [Fervidicoccus fontis]